MINERNQKAGSIEDVLKEIQQGARKTQNTHSKSSVSNSDKDETLKIDVLNLPPRKEIHGSNTKVSFKLSRPFSRLLIVIFLLTVILASSYYFWGEDIASLINNMSN